MLVLGLEEGLVECATLCVLVTHKVCDFIFKLKVQYATSQVFLTEGKSIYLVNKFSYKTSFLVAIMTHELINES